MQNPKILITAAAGKTGMATALDLLRQGFPVVPWYGMRMPAACALKKPAQRSHWAPWKILRT